MKTEQEVRERLAEISVKIDNIYHEFKHGNMLEKDFDDARGIFQTREDMLEWVLAD